MTRTCAVGPGKKTSRGISNEGQEESDLIIMRSWEENSEAHQTQWKPLKATNADVAWDVKRVEMV
ncbi:uncharacterized protein N7483_006932 [Penicillium malachiteum]|uniref:uncharacterized protein n=1 Tax=Penicillium malachiteum TaxID=1324776 RepID=UPI002548B611|nr:uncharacterized protein N7483_006932 [Penicillium malachiteum]KAJ5725575.1 hypothetical protein N7483_006932 [Penicillium malachiteum]